MKMLKSTAHLFLTLVVAALPLAAISAEDKKADVALMEPVKSVLDHYLKIQGELAKDSIKALTNTQPPLPKLSKATI